MFSDVFQDFPKVCEISMILLHNKDINSYQQHCYCARSATIIYITPNVQFSRDNTLSRKVAMSAFDPVQLHDLVTYIFELKQWIFYWQDEETFLLGEKSARTLFIDNIYTVTVHQIYCF